MVKAPTAAPPSRLAPSRMRARGRRSRGGIRGSGRSNRLAGQDQRSVLAAKAERVRHHGGDAGVARLVGNDVEGNRRIRNVVIVGGRNELGVKRLGRCATL